MIFEVRHLPTPELEIPDIDVSSLHSKRWPQAFGVPVWRGIWYPWGHEVLSGDDLIGPTTGCKSPRWFVFFLLWSSEAGSRLTRAPDARLQRRGGAGPWTRGWDFERGSHPTHQPAGDAPSFLSSAGCA